MKLVFDFWAQTDERLFLLSLHPPFIFPDLPSLAHPSTTAHPGTPVDLPSLPPSTPPTLLPTLISTTPSSSVPVLSPSSLLCRPPLSIMGRFVSRQL